MSDYNSRYNIVDEEDIENVKQQQSQDVIDNNMLGDFNNDGHYVVDKGIINEMIMTVKVVTKSFGNFRFCETTKKFDGVGHIKFAIDLSPNPEDGQAVAVLVLLESMKACNGFIENTNGLAIAKFVGNNDKSFVERAMRYFNTFLPDDLDGASYIENDKDINFPNTLARLSYLRSIRDLSDPFINQIETESYKKKKKVLSENKNGKEVFDDFDAEKEGIYDKFIDKNSDKYYKMLNSLLDATIEKNEKKIRADKELTTSLKEVETSRRSSSREVIARSERETVDRHLTDEAESVFDKRTKNSKSVGASQLAVYKEGKKSYADIENEERARYEVRNREKEVARSTGARIFGKDKTSTKEYESATTEEKDNTRPEKLSERPSYVKNNRYEEIKNNAEKGEKISTNPSPYSKNINENTSKSVNENEKSSTATKTAEQTKTNTNASTKTNTQQNTNTNTSTQTQQQEQTQQDKRPRIVFDSFGRPIPPPGMTMDPRIYPGYSGRPFGYNPYEMNQPNIYQRDTGGYTILDIFDDNKPRQDGEEFGMRPPSPPPPQQKPVDNYENNYNNQFQTTPGDDKFDDTYGEIGIPKGEVPEEPVFKEPEDKQNQEEIMKQIFGSGLYELTKQAEEKLAQQQKQNQNQNSEENADVAVMVFTHTKQ